MNDGEFELHMKLQEVSGWDFPNDDFPWFTLEFLIRKIPGAAVKNLGLDKYRAYYHDEWESVDVSPVNAMVRLALFLFEKRILLPLEEGA